MLAAVLHSCNSMAVDKLSFGTQRFRYQCLSKPTFRPNPVRLRISDRRSVPLVLAAIPPFRPRGTQLVTRDENAKQNPVKEWLGKAAKTAAVLGMAAALILLPVGAADAARSGGRAGGSRFSAARSYSAPSSSYSAPSRGGYSSYGGGAVAPSVGASFFFPVSPWGYGYGGYGYGTVAPAGGGGVFTLLVEVLLVAVLVSVVAGWFMNNSTADEEEEYYGGGGRMAVAKLQVGLLGSARGLQRDLDRIASRADTSTAEGLFYILQETVLALNRNPDYWVYGGTDVKTERGFDNAEAAFNELSLNERSKFREETLSNIDGRTKNSSYSKAINQGDSELIVVTILVAAETTLNLPRINSSSDLRTALNRVGSVPEQSIVAVEVLWTPQDPNDYYTRDEVMADYPELAVL